jgi:hypothetical protein
MFNKEIQFIAHKDYVEIEQDQPTPIKLNVPTWYKKLTHEVNNQTVKGCIPFLNSMTYGYVLKMPLSIHIKHNVYNEDKKQFDSFYTVGEIEEQLLYVKSINLNKKTPSVHPIFQAEGSPLVNKNKNLPFYKILNPWTIKTPPGYSCLFIPPLNNSDDRFSIIPGIVDTDTYLREINFPIVLNGDKYSSLETTLERGTPYVQIIPFKRDNWKMKIKKTNTEEIRKNSIFYGLDLINIYKKKFWNKVSWN